MKVIITTVPFGVISPRPFDLLKEGVSEFSINPFNRKLRPEEVAGVIGDADIVIAGTEPITSEVMDLCPNLKSICRVGIGLDSVDLLAARARGIDVSYTPDAPSPAVAELTLGLMIDLLRGISKADRDIRTGTWLRTAGRRLSESCIGIIGCGRIGGQVIEHIRGGFPSARILANDIVDVLNLNNSVEWVSKEQIYRECDIISLHVPLTPETKNLISAEEFQKFKTGALLLNTARGGIVNEHELVNALRNGSLQAAAIDAFEEEPYTGKLRDIGNVVLTCHLGSMTQDCRAQMEIEATEEAVRFHQGAPFINPVPEAEYVLAARNFQENRG